MQIDKNVPIPPKHMAGRGNSKYRYHNKIIETWEVGDSVAFEYVEKATGKDKRPAYSVEGNSFSKKAKKAGQKVSTRVMADEGVIRIWRMG